MHIWSSLTAYINYFDIMNYEAKVYNEIIIQDVFTIVSSYLYCKKYIPVWL